MLMSKKQRSQALWVGHFFGWVNGSREILNLKATIKLSDSENDFERNSA